MSEGSDQPSRPELAQMETLETSAEPVSSSTVPESPDKAAADSLRVPVDEEVAAESCEAEAECVPDEPSTAAAGAPAAAANTKKSQTRKLRSPTKLGFLKSIGSKPAKLPAAGDSKLAVKGSKSSTKSDSRSGTASTSGHGSSTQQAAAAAPKVGGCGSKTASQTAAAKSAPKRDSGATKPSVGRLSTRTSASKLCAAGRGATTQVVTTVADSSTRQPTPPSVPPKSSGARATVAAAPRIPASGTSSFKGPVVAAAAGMAATMPRPKKGSGTGSSSTDSAGRVSKTSLGTTSASSASGIKPGSEAKPRRPSGVSSKAADAKVKSLAPATKPLAAGQSAAASAKKFVGRKPTSGGTSPSLRGSSARAGLQTGLKEDKKSSDATQKAIGPGHYKKRLSYNAPASAPKPALKKAKEAPGAVGRPPLDMDAVGQAEPSGEGTSGEALCSPSPDSICPEPELDQESQFLEDVGASQPLLAHAADSQGKAVLRDPDVGVGEGVDTISGRLGNLQLQERSSDETARNTMSSVDDIKSSEKFSAPSLVSSSFTFPRHSADDATKIKAYPFPQRQALLKHGLSLSVDQLRRGPEVPRSHVGSQSAETSAIPSPVFDQSASMKESPSVSIETDHGAVGARPDSVQATRTCEFPLALDASEASSVATVGAESQQTKTDDQTPRKRVNMMKFFVKPDFVPADPKDFANQLKKIPEETRLDKAMMILLANSYRTLIKERERAAAEKLLENAAKQSYSSSNLGSCELSQAATPGAQPSRLEDEDGAGDGKVSPATAGGAEEGLSVAAGERDAVVAAAVVSPVVAADERDVAAAVVSPVVAADERDVAAAVVSPVVAADERDVAAAAADERGAAAAAGGPEHSTTSSSGSTTALSGATSLTDDQSGWSEGSVVYDLLYNIGELQVSSLLDSKEYLSEYLTHHRLVCEAIALLRCCGDDLEMRTDVLRVLCNYTETDFCYFVLKYASEHELRLIKEAAAEHQLRVMEDKEQVRNCISHDEGLIWL